jgi:TfoX/Sxy family transcriptional regulator of competence genes
MAYDENLADRIREVLSAETEVDERRMFGGLGFMVRGNMVVAATNDGGLMVRVPREDTEKLVRRAHVEAMVMSGRAIQGWVRVSAEGVATMRQLRGWVQRGLDFAQTL